MRFLCFLPPTLWAIGVTAFVETGSRLPRSSGHSLAARDIPCLTTTPPSPGHIEHLRGLAGTPAAFLKRVLTSASRWFACDVHLRSATIPLRHYPDCPPPLAAGIE
jgi:hypothetical protein